MKYLTVNAFAKICGVSKHTLYHYEDVGILKPVFVSENNYRYYSYRQYDKLRFILALRELDISIEEIRNYINSSSDDLDIFLGANIEKIDAKIEQLKRMKQFMEDLIEQSKSVKKADLQGISIEEKGRIPILKSEHLKKNLDYEQTMEAYAKFCYEHGVDIGHRTGQIMELKNICEGRYFDYAHVYVEAGTMEGNAVIEKGRFLKAYHVGAYEECYKTYQRLMEYAQKEKFQLDTVGYEEYVTNNILVQDDNAQITKIFIRIIE